MKTFLNVGSIENDSIENDIIHYLSSAKLPGKMACGDNIRSYDNIHDPYVRAEIDKLLADLTDLLLKSGRVNSTYQPMINIETRVPNPDKYITNTNDIRPGKEHEPDYVSKIVIRYVPAHIDDDKYNVTSIFHKPTPTKQ